MTQITATLSQEADPNLIRQIFENVKGVLKVSIHRDKKTSDNEKTVSEDWEKDLQTLVNRIDRTAIDIDDERTRYILRGSELLNELETKRK